MPTNVTAIDGLEKLRKGLTGPERKIVRFVVAQYERDLIESLPELNEGVQTAEAEGSFTDTLQIKKGKRGRFKAKLTPRVRIPRESTEFDLHIGTEGQLELGLPADYDDNPDPGGDGEPE